MLVAFRERKAGFVWPVSCQYGCVIAKAILDLFTLLPGTSRSATQTSDQPLQAFSDSLLAATKSYSQCGATVSANGKTVRGQSSISGSTNTSVAVLDDGDDLSPADLQSAQAAGSTPNSFQTPVVGLTISETGSTETAVQPGQIQPALDPAASQSTTAQTGYVQSNVFASRLARAAGFQSRFTGTRTQRAGSATSQIVSTGVATRPFRNVTVTRLASTESIAAQSGVAQQAAVQPVFTLVQRPLAPSETAQSPSTSTVSPAEQGLASAEPAQSQSVIPQTSAPSNIVPAQSPLATPASAQRASTGLAARLTQIASAIGLPAIRTVFAQDNNVPVSVSQANVPQLSAAQSNLTAMQTPLAAASTTQTTSPVVAGQPASNLPTVAWKETDSLHTLANILSTSIPRQANVSSSVAQAQMPVAAPAATQSDATVVTGQPILNVLPTESTEDQSIVPQTSTLQAPVSQSNSVPMQMPVAVPVATQDASSAAASQPALNLPAVAWNETGSIFTLASILSTSIPRSASLQSNVAPAQTPNAAPATSQNDSTVAIGQPALNATVAGWNRTGTSFTPANIISTNISEPDANPAQTPDAAAAATLNASPVVASQPVSSVPASTWNESGSMFTLASILSTSIPQPANVPSNDSPAQIVVAAAVPAQNAPTAVSSPNTWSLPATGLAATGSTVPRANISQPAIDQSNFTPVQTLLTAPETAQSISTVVASQPMQTIPAARMAETQSIIAKASVAPASLPRTNSLQQAADPSDVTTAQTPLAGSSVAQNASTPTTSQPSINVVQIQSTETSSIVSQAGTVTTNFYQASTTEPDAAWSSNSLRQTSTDDSMGTQFIPVIAASQQPSQTAPAAERNQAVSTIAPPSNASTSIPQAAVVFSSATPVQTLLSASTTTMNTSTALAAQPPVTAAPATQPNPMESSVAPVNVPRPVTAAATDQSTSKVVPSETAMNVAATGSTGTQSIVPQASIVLPNISEPATVESKITPVQIHGAGLARTQEASPAESSLVPAQTVPSAGWNEAEASIAPMNMVPAKVAQTDIPQPAAAQSRITAAQTSLVQPADTQDTLGTKLESTPSGVTQTIIVPISANQQVAETQDLSVPASASAKCSDANANAVAAAVPNATPVASSSEVQASPSPADVNANSNAVQSAVANHPAETTSGPVLHEAVIASVKDVAAPAFKTGLAVQTDPQPAAANRNSVEKTITVASGTADQLAVLPQTASIGAIQTKAANLKPVSATKPQASATSATKGSSTDQTGAKKNDEAVSGTGTKTGSQDAASSGNQSQTGTTSQAQITAPVAVDFTVHPAAAIAASQNTATVAVNHTSSTSAEAAGVAAKTANNSTTQSSTALPQTAPVINTARLIQNMGQSEMRVGMRSNEFGNISISTSATRDQVSAQISVEHGELAKTLTAHLPEMQARLGSSQPMDVRIDMNGAATGQGTGNFGGMSNDSAGQSRSGRQQAGNIAAGQSGNGVAEQQFSPVVAAVPSGYARLDIRV